MKIKQIIALLLCVTLLGGLLASCGDKGPGQETTADTATETETVAETTNPDEGKPVEDVFYQGVEDFVENVTNKVEKPGVVYEQITNVLLNGSVDAAFSSDQYNLTGTMKQFANGSQIVLNDTVKNDMILTFTQGTDKPGYIYFKSLDKYMPLDFAASDDDSGDAGFDLGGMGSIGGGFPLPDIGSQKPGLDSLVILAGLLLGGSIDGVEMPAGIEVTEDGLTIFGSEIHIDQDKFGHMEEFESVYDVIESLLEKISDSISADSCMVSEVTITIQDAQIVSTKITCNITDVINATSDMTGVSASGEPIRMSVYRANGETVRLEMTTDANVGSIGMSMIDQDGTTLYILTMTDTADPNAPIELTMKGSIKADMNGETLTGLTFHTDVELVSTVEGVKVTTKGYADVNATISDTLMEVKIVLNTPGKDGGANVTYNALINLNFDTKVLSILVKGEQDVVVLDADVHIVTTEDTIDLPNPPDEQILDMSDTKSMFLVMASLMQYEGLYRIVSAFLGGI